jgi:hypothetical protein
MSVANPLPRSLRRSDYTAVAGQRIFGATPWLAFDVEDVRVRVRVPPAVAWTTITTGFTVAISPAGAGNVTVTFAADRDEDDEVRVEGKRTHARITDVTRAGSIRTAPLERELDKMAVVLQELHRDVEEAETTTETALGLIDGVAGSAAAASAAADEATAAAGAATVAAAALTGATIGTAGLATGGDDVVNSPIITVPKASSADAQAGVNDAKALTPAGLFAGAEYAPHLPSWTGARTRTLRQLARDWCRLDHDTQFDPTGTVSMNTLIANALAAYENVIIPRNAIARVSTITIPGNNRRIVGEGPSSVLRMPNGGNTNLIQASAKSGLRFENFTLDGNKANNSAGNGTDIQGCTDVRFDGVRVVSWFGNGIILQVFCNDVVVSDCYINDVGSHGVSLSEINGAIVKSNRIIDARLSGVNLGAVGNFAISDNVLSRALGIGASGGGAGGIRTTNSSTVGTITGNTIVLYDRGIMLITGAQITTVGNNTILQPWYDGLFIQGTGPLPALDITATGNTIVNANQSNSGSYDGIRIDGSAGAIVTTGNNIRDGRGAPQMQYGIRDTSTGAGSNIGRQTSPVNFIGGAAIAAVN